jgi:2'-5' RNA ligase
VTASSDTETRAAFDEAWAQFQHLDAVRPAEDTLEGSWSRGRATFLALLVRIEDPAVRTHIERIQQRIADIPCVEVYPQPYWHITVKGIGFLVDAPSRDDDVARDDIGRIASQAEALLIEQPAFEARPASANGFPEVVFIEVHDGGRVRALNTLLAERLPKVPRLPFDGAAFLPHVSIARFHSSEGLPALKSRLAELRTEEPGPAFRVGEVELIEARLTSGTPEIHTLATFRLASQ